VFLLSWTDAKLEQRAGGSETRPYESRLTTDCEQPARRRRYKFNGKVTGNCDGKFNCARLRKKQAAATNSTASATAPIRRLAFPGGFAAKFACGTGYQ